MLVDDDPVVDFEITDEEFQKIPDKMSGVRGRSCVIYDVMIPNIKQEMLRRRALKTPVSCSVTTHEVFFDVH